jgi:hypothetical protein
MDAKDLKEKPKDSFSERLTVFLVINFFRAIIIGCFNLIACWIPIVFVMLFNLITEKPIILDGKTYIYCYILSFIFLFWLLIIKNGNTNKNKV